MFAPQMLINSEAKNNQDSPPKSKIQLSKQEKEANRIKIKLYSNILFMIITLVSHNLNISYMTFIEVL